MEYTVYIVQCVDDSLYTGYTSDIQKRIKEHNEGKRGARYTKTRRPVKLVFAQQVRSRSRAMKSEAEIKKLNREEKLRLIRKNK